MIRPPRVFLEATFTAGASIPPIGLAYVNASLEAAGFEVFAIDAIGEDLDQYYKISDVPGLNVQGMYLEDIIAKIPADTFVIGMSCMFSAEWVVHETLLKAIKAQFPNVPIVLGGEHVSAESENILRTCPAVDICVSGEGEVTMVELAKAFANSGNWKNVDGISYRHGDHVVKNKSRARNKDINSIPSPSWKNIPVERYHELGYSTGSVFRPSMPILASRGCPYRCTFCTSPQMWGTDIYLRDPKSVIDEIKMYSEKYPITHIEFIDIVGVMNRKWVRELMHHWVEAGLKLTWIYAAGTRSEILDEEILSLFKKTNMLRLMYAPESGSKETIKRIKKRIDLDKMMRSMETANSMGLILKAPLLYGLPGQTFKEAMESVWFSFKLSWIGVDDVVAHAFSAHPGSELHNGLLDSGKINMKQLMEDGQYKYFLMNEATAKTWGLHSWSDSIPNWTLPFFQTGVMLLSYLILFIRRPSKLVATLQRTFIDRAPVTLLDHVLFDKFVSRRIHSFSEPRELRGYKFTKEPSGKSVRLPVAG